MFFFLACSPECTPDSCLALLRKSLRSHEMDFEGSHFDGNIPHIFVVLGASVSQRTNCENIVIIFRFFFLCRVI